MFLVDGYNLLHAMGILKGRAGPSGLHKARLGLLGLLHAVYGEDSVDVTVVFDAASCASDRAEENYQGLHIRWAIDHPSADDLIEGLIQHCAAPKQLTVVSDDHRIRDAARRRECKVLGCFDYLEWLERHRQKRLKDERRQPSKPQQVSDKDSQYWLSQFADLEDSPELKRLSDPAEWKEIDE
jgi:predicted RNA-binding protein with PIN domain